MPCRACLALATVNSHLMKQPVHIPCKEAPYSSDADKPHEVMYLMVCTAIAGTSMAAPLVSGVVGLCLSVLRTAPCNVRGVSDEHITRVVIQCQLADDLTIFCLIKSTPSTACNNVSALCGQAATVVTIEGSRSGTEKAACISSCHWRGHAMQLVHHTSLFESTAVQLNAVASLSARFFAFSCSKRGVAIVPALKLPAAPVTAGASGRHCIQLCAQHCRPCRCFVQHDWHRGQAQLRPSCGMLRCGLQVGRHVVCEFCCHMVSSLSSLQDAAHQVARMAYEAIYGYFAKA
jgi:hypothetical protein